jgi:hypothetical protein
MIKFSRNANNTIPENLDEALFGQNIVNLENKTMDWIMNGKRGNGYSLSFSQYSCWPVNSCNPPAPDPVEPEPEFRYWSDAANWPNNKLPVTNDSVVITPGYKLILDLEETPIFHELLVYGNLYFSDEMDVHLRTNNIFNRMGEVHIGSASAPY